jgi:Domain of unknown function (DUF4124)
MIGPAATTLLLAASLTLASSVPGSAQTIYRWHDASGGLHFSNQSGRTPASATAVELPPLGSIQIPASAKRTRRIGRAHTGTPPPAAPCGPADPAGLAEAIDLGLPNAAPASSLTLLVGGLPVSTSRDASVQTLVTPWDPDEPQAHLSQSAIAYPVGSSCPDFPPLVRYPTNTRRSAGSRGLCDDYRRAFAQVGVATSRDAGVARSFRDIAQSFVRIGLEGNDAVASGFRVAVDDGMFTSDAMQLAPHMTVPLDPWIVAAHVSQTESLATESDDLVEQLTVALEEIARAARASGCWN